MTAFIIKTIFKVCKIVSFRMILKVYLHLNHSIRNKLSCNTALYARPLPNVKRYKEWSRPNN